MSRLIKVLILCCIAAAPAFAADGPPTPESVHKLLEVTHARQLLDANLAQIDTAMQAGIRQALRGQSLSAEQQQIVDGMQTKMMGLFKEFLTWEILEPTVVDAYTHTFTQSEVNGMLAFYATPPGKALITKTPQVMQSMSQATQARMSALMPKLQQLQRDTMAQLQAASNSAPAPAPAPAPPPAPK